MISKIIKYYRLSRHMTKRDLAAKIDVTPMAITNYEKGDRVPSMDILQKLAAALGVRISDFLVSRDERIVFSHGEFRKNASLSSSQEDYIRESVEEYFNRFMSVVDILGGEVLPDAPLCNVIELTNDSEQNAILLRQHLGFAIDGPIDDLIGKLENKGILIFECSIDSKKFSGMNGFVGDRPYIAVNPNMTAERIRSTIVHELAHLMFVWPEGMTEKEQEQMATAISGAFLFPRKDAIRELGVHRSYISQDMLLVAIEYGISMMLLVKRAALSRIISSAVERDFYIKASKAGWRTAEPSRIDKEKPALFEQLVYRAVNLGEISVQRGAELLHVSYNVIQSMCRFDEV